MSIGARIRNEGGSLVQIDGNYENLALKAVGSVTTTQFAQSGVGASAGIATIIVPGCNQPILVTDCPSQYIALKKRSRSGSTFTWEIISSVPTIDVNYYVFDTTDVAQMSFQISKGLRIRRESDGVTIFDSRYKYLRVIGILNGRAGESISVPQVAAYGVGHANSSGVTVVAGGPVGGGPYWLNNNLYYVVGMKNESGILKSQTIQLYLTVTDGPNNAPPTGQFGSDQAFALACDISNY